MTTGLLLCAAFEELKNNIITFTLAFNTDNMKHFIALVFFVGCLLLCNAQTWPLTQVTQIPYYNPYTGHKRLCLSGTSFYALRQAGIEEIDTSTYEMDYHWANQYGSSVILPDSNGNYIYLRSLDFIGKYNPITQQHENIINGPLQNFELYDIDIGANGNIWATGSDSSYNFKVGIFNAGNWQVFPAPQGIYNILCINDTSAYVRVMNIVYVFHQGVFDSLYLFHSGLSFYDWDVDANGSLWIAGGYLLVNVSGSVITVYDSTNTPIPHNNQFLTVIAGTNGHIWTSSNGNELYEFDGSTWNTHIIGYNIENFTLDQQNRPWVIFGSAFSNVYENTNIGILNGISLTTIPFPYLPYQNITALGIQRLATDQGVYDYDAGMDFRVNFFMDSVLNPNVYPNDVTCIETFFTTPSTFTRLYGTHHGVYGVQNLNNGLLPSDTINYMFYHNGTEYICTDNGLMMFNNIIYSYFDTSNTPLPSNKITFAISDTSLSNGNSLYLGTDKGIAIYNNTQWTVYDTTNIPVSNFYVTGILPACYWYPDSAILVTTLGSGLIKLYPSGGYEILNTINGFLADDSLYYVIPTRLGPCDPHLMIGTNSHGIASLEPLISNQFYYNDTTSGFPFTQSKYAVWTYYFRLIATNAGIFYGYNCTNVGIEESNSDVSSINWFMQNDNVVITVPKDFSGQGKLLLYDMTGRVVKSLKENIVPFQKISLNVSDISPGIYLIHLMTGSKQGSAKVMKE
jgi:hypothetical protein